MTTVEILLGNVPICKKTCVQKFQPIRVKIISLLGTGVAGTLEAPLNCTTSAQGPGTQYVLEVFILISKMS